MKGKLGKEEGRVRSGHCTAEGIEKAETGVYSGQDGVGKIGEDVGGGN